MRNLGSEHPQQKHINLVGGWTKPVEKYYIVKMGIFPDFRGDNKKYLTPPSSNISDGFWGGQIPL